MDVGDPSNFVRIQKIYGMNIDAMKKDITGYVCPNEEIFNMIDQVYKENQYILDPHGAIGFKSLQELLGDGETGIFLATAHPAKFPVTVEEIIKRPVEQPDRLKVFLRGDKKVEELTNEFEGFKSFLEKVCK